MKKLIVSYINIKIKIIYNELKNFIYKDIGKNLYITYVYNKRRVIKMMHTICKYADDTELVISDIIKRENGEKIIKVVFERPTEHGFDTLILNYLAIK